MPSLTPEIMLAFQDELEKQARIGALLRGAGSYLARQGTTAGAGAGLGGLLGGAAGAGIGGVSGYRKAREQGATRSQALVGALKGGGTGLAAGGMLGAGLGAAGGLASGGRGRALAGKLREGKGLLSGASRVGERQVHGLTGAVPQVGKGGKALGKVEAIRQMGAGSAPAMARLEGAAAGLKGTTGKARDKAIKEMRAARKGLDVATEAEEMGITSLPGYLKGLAGRGKYVGGAKAGQRVGSLQALKTGVGEQWHSMGAGGKALTFGLPAAGIASEAARPSKPGEEGRGARVGKSLGGLAYSLAPIPLAGITALGAGASALGGLAGKGVDKAVQGRGVRQ